MNVKEINKYNGKHCKITFRLGKTGYIMTRVGIIEDIENIMFNRNTYYRLDTTKTVHGIANKHILSIEEIEEAK